MIFAALAAAWALVIGVCGTGVAAWGLWTEHEKRLQWGFGLMVISVSVIACCIIFGRILA